MADFEQTRGQLGAARAETEAAERALFESRHKLDRSRQSRQRRARTGSDSDQIDQQIKTLEAEVDGRKAKLQDARKAEIGSFTKFADFTDPRKHSGRLSDRIPVLLVPLRIETRFKRQEEIGGDSDELWVRVYPDDI